MKTVRAPRPGRRIGAAALLALGIAALGAGSARSAAAPLLNRPAPLLNRPAPPFTRSDLAGKTLRLGDYRGKVVLLNFWATWCGPCVAEVPRFSAWQKRYAAAGLQVIGVSMDDGGAVVKRFLRRTPLAYPIVLGDARLGRLYGGINGLPQSFLIDPRGRIVARYVGELDLARLQMQIKALLPRRPG